MISGGGESWNLKDISDTVFSLCPFPCQDGRAASAVLVSAMFCFCHLFSHPGPAVQLLNTKRPGIVLWPSHRRYSIVAQHHELHSSCSKLPKVLPGVVWPLGSDRCPDPAVFLRNECRSGDQVLEELVQSSCGISFLGDPRLGTTPSTKSSSEAEL